MPDLDPNTPEGQLAAASESLATATANLTTALADLAALNAEKATLTAQVTQLNADLAAANDLLSEETAKVTRLEGELATVKVDRTNYNADVAREVARIAAGSGGAPAAVTPDNGKGPEASESKTLTQLWAECSAITNQGEQRAFYLKHIKPRS
ncbi:hypothetical protein [Verrucomicrobium sp. BvORR106]|uniref:hypothetical protein n=1 Tax=Verrucomicrobium sp. BvORR106 TaxID=1403819 RepID=UPI00056F0B70|nr:hypothetical protein [Verrucomicrobium sp. BvORR106]